MIDGIILIGGFSLLVVTLITLCKFACSSIYKEKLEPWKLDE